MYAFAAVADDPKFREENKTTRTRYVRTHARTPSSSSDLPQLRGLLRERDHCVNAGQCNPRRRICPTSRVRPRNRITV